MDDECVAELGRPISSMKVTELRDELTRRSLIKTGNKKELIDRLRTAIRRQSSQNAGATDLTIQSATHQLAQQDQPADLSQPEDDAEDLDEDDANNKAQHQQPLDYNLASSTTPNSLNQQMSHPVIMDQPQNLAIKPSQSNLTEELAPQEVQKPLSPPAEQQQTLSKVSPESVSLEAKQPHNISLSEDLQQRESEQQSPDNLNPTVPAGKLCEAAIDYSSQESTNQPNEEVSMQQDDTTSKTTDASTDPANLETRASDILSKDDHSPSESNRTSTESLSSRPSANESEKVSVHVPITLKRGTSSELRNSSENKEKRRKWSTKTENLQSSETTSRANITSVGISSQKLQQLIEVRKAEQSTNDKAVSASTSGVRNDSGKAEVESKKKKTGIDSSASQPDSAVKISNINYEEDHQAQKEVAVDGQADTIKESVSVPEQVKQEPESVLEPTNILLVQNLVRPFTLSQLKEVLTKYGPMVEEKFWIDKVKSTCCVMFEDNEIAQQTRDALNGQQWPSSNPKTLKVTYIEEESLTRFINQEVAKVIEPEISEKVDQHEEDEKLKGNVQQVGGKPITNRLGDKIDDAEGANVGQSLKKRLGDKVSGEVSTKTSNISRASDNSHPQELDDLFKRTKSIPHLFWLPLSEDQAETRQKKRAEKRARDQELARKAPRRVTPQRWRPSPRRSPPLRHRSPARRSPARRRSPPRRSPIGQRSPIRRSSPPKYRSPRSPVGYRSPVSRRSPPPTRSSPPRRRSPGPIRRSPGPIRRSPGRRSPMLRRSPGPIRRSPGPIRRSPGLSGPLRRSPGPIRRSPVHVRRSPAPIRGASPPRRSISRSRSRSPIRRRSRTPPRRKSPVGHDPRRAQRFDRIR